MKRIAILTAAALILTCAQFALANQTTYSVALEERAVSREADTIQDLAIDIYLEGTYPLRAVHLNFEWDEGLAFREWILGMLPNPLVLFEPSAESGTLLLACDAVHPKGRLHLGTLHFERIGEAGVLSIAESTLPGGIGIVKDDGELIPIDASTQGIMRIGAPGEATQGKRGLADEALHPRPRVLWLGPAAPNPTAGLSRIAFGLPDPMRARLQIFDAKGRHVRDLINGPLEAGVHAVVWDGRAADGLPAGSGLFLYRLTAGEEVREGRLLLSR